MRYFLCFICMTTYLCADPIVAAYYQSYAKDRPGVENRAPFSINAIDPRIVTDLYYAFGSFGSDFVIEEKDPHLEPLKQNAPTLRLFLSIGGWNFNDPIQGKNTYLLFSQMVSNSDNRKKFIHSAIDYAHHYGFHGIDIDWEYPGDVTRGGSIHDFDNFLNFLKECSSAFATAAPSLELSYCIPAHIPVGIPESFQKNYYSWIAQCAAYVDRINVMAYDYHTPFEIPKITGVNAPLNRDTNPQSNYFIARTLENYLNSGVPANKVLLALPIFGHSYAGVKDMTEESNGPGKPFTKPGPPGPATNLAGLLAYFEISDLIAAKKLTFGIDAVTSTAFGYNLTTHDWISFDTPDTIKLKAQLAVEKQLKGVVLWSIDMDEYQWPPRYPNLRSAWNVFHN